MRDKWIQDTDSKLIGQTGTKSDADEKKRKKKHNTERRLYKKKDYVKKGVQNQGKKTDKAKA